jgi:hypothetical protein
MTEPKIEEKPGLIRLTWESEQIVVSVTRAREHTSDGRVTGEIAIDSTTPNASGHIHEAQFNFSSTATRDKLSKTLTGRAPDVSWEDIISQLCYRVVRIVRRGEPVRELWTGVDIRQPEFLLKPFLYRGLPTIFFGEKAVCKSTMAIAIYSCLILPWQENPWGWEVSDHSVPTIIFDYEVDGEISQWSADKLKSGMGMPNFPVYHRRCSVPFADDIEEINKWITEYKAEAIIIDSLGPAVGGDLKDPAIALRLTSAIRKLNVAALIIGQTSKDKEAKTKSVFGSTFFEYYARNIWEIRKSQEEGAQALDVALFNTYHNLGRKFSPLGYHIDFEDNRTIIESTPITAPELKARFSLTKQIIDLLKEQGKLTPKQLAEQLDISNLDKIYVNLARLKKTNIVVKLDDGYWGLLSNS